MSNSDNPTTQQAADLQPDSQLAIPLHIAFSMRPCREEPLYCEPLYCETNRSLVDQSVLSPTFARYLDQRGQLPPISLFMSGYRPFGFVLTQLVQLFVPLVALLHLSVLDQLLADISRPPGRSS